MPVVLNKRNLNALPENSVYCGRPSKWGNPFNKEMVREIAVVKHKNWVLSNPAFIEEIKTELKGKDLVCWCAPKICHCDILLQIANPGIEEFFSWQ